MDENVLHKRDGDLKGIGWVGKIVSIVVLVWLISVSYYAFGFFILGMLPAIVALVVDRGSGRFASKTVMACNFVGILPFLFDIGRSYERSLAAMQLMIQPMTWVVIYGFSAVGWILIWILPQVTTLIFLLRSDLKSKNLREEQKELTAEWGEEVSQEFVVKAPTQEDDEAAQDTATKTVKK